MAVVPEISVIIPTYDRAESLVITLESLALQAIEPDRFEIIVVDDGSADDTSERVTAFARSHPALAVRYERHKTNRYRAAACNTGINAARGEFVVFTDDDIRPVPGWLVAHLARHKRENHDVSVTGLVLCPEEWERQSNWVRFANSNYRLNAKYARRDHELPPNRFAGGNTSIRRRTIIDAGLFDETIRRGQDGELACRLFRRGIPLVYEENAVAYHYSEAIRSIPQTLKSFRRFYERDRLEIRGRYPWYSARYGHWFLEPVDLRIDRLRERVVKRLLRLVARRSFQSLALAYLKRTDGKPFLYSRLMHQFVLSCEAIDAMKVGDQAAAAAVSLSPARQTPATRMPGDLEVSIVLATYNRANSLRGTLSSIAAQTLHPSQFEIVIVDDGSSDHTQEVVERFAAEHPELAVIFHRNKENKRKAASCNTGIHLARGRLIAFVDDDIRPVPEWLESHLLRHRTENRDVSVTGAVLYPVEWEDRSNWVRFANDNYRTNEVLSIRGPRGLPPSRFAGGNTSVPKAALVKVGMYNEHNRRFEDAELGCKLHLEGLPLIHEPAALVYHHAEAIRTIDGTLRSFRRSYEFDRPAMRRKFPWFFEQYGHWFIEPVGAKEDTVFRVVVKTVVRIVAQKPSQFIAVAVLKVTDRQKWLYSRLLHRYVLTCEAVDAIRASERRLQFGGEVTLARPDQS